MFHQDAGFIMTNGIKYLLADGGVSVEDRFDHGGNEETGRRLACGLQPVQP